MTVHFVCSGNTYRSRLAEAYLNSKRLANVKGVSSGVNASDNNRRPTSWLIQRLIEINKLVLFEKPNWTQTTKLLLDSADLTIFFDRKYYNYCVKQFKFHPHLFEIWDIGDLDKNIKDDVEKIRVTEGTFNLIRQKVDDLVERKKF
jgi:protein-tyrosine-phosphatase